MPKEVRSRPLIPEGDGVCRASFRGPADLRPAAVGELRGAAAGALQNDKGRGGA